MILVIGHGSCGAVAAAIEGGDAGKNLNHLLGFNEPAVREAEDKSVNSVTKVNAKNSAKALVQNSDILNQAVQNEDVQIRIAYYNLGSGQVDFGELTLG